MSTDAREDVQHYPFFCLFFKLSGFICFEAISRQAQHFQWHTQATLAKARMCEEIEKENNDKTNCSAVEHCFLWKNTNQLFHLTPKHDSPESGRKSNKWNCRLLARAVPCLRQIKCFGAYVIHRKIEVI